MLQKSTALNVLFTVYRVVAPSNAAAPCAVMLQRNTVRSLSSDMPPVMRPLPVDENVRRRFIIAYIPCVPPGGDTFAKVKQVLRK